MTPPYAEAVTMDLPRPEVPVPQLWLHLDQEFHCDRAQLTGQFWMLQSLDTWRDGQTFPPYATGWVMERLLD
jgi:hypothetical protein